MINVCCKFLCILQSFFLQITRTRDSKVLRLPKNVNHDTYGDLSILLCATEFSLYKYRVKDSSNAHRHTLSASEDTFFISIVHGEGIKAVVRWLDAALAGQFGKKIFEPVSFQLDLYEVIKLHQWKELLRNLHKTLF